MKLKQMYLFMRGVASQASRIKRSFIREVAKFEMYLFTRGQPQLESNRYAPLQVAASQGCKMKIPFIREAAAPLNHIDIPFAKVAADLEIETDVSLYERSSCTLDQIDMPFLQVAAGQACRMKIPFSREVATPLNHIDIPLPKCWLIFKLTQMYLFMREAAGQASKIKIPFIREVANLEIKTDVSFYKRGSCTAPF